MGFEALLVLFVLLLVLALDDLLGLLGHTVELDIKGSLLVVFNHEGQSLNFVLDLLQLGVMLQDLFHVVDLGVTLVHDTIILGVDHADIDEDGILVVGGDRQLWDFDLTLLHVGDDLEVELQLFLTINRLLEAHLGVLEFLDDVLLLTFKEHDEVT